MLKLQKSDYADVESQLIELFREWYYLPLLEIITEKKYNTVFNSISDLINAIRSGKVKYENGIFTGTFNAKISRELSKFAKYDGRKKVWKGRPPSDVLAAAIVANDKAKELNSRLLKKISQLGDNVKAQVKKIGFDIHEAISKIDGKLVKEVENITVMPEITQGMRDYLSEQYTNNMQLNIVNEGGQYGNWNAEQVERLRDMVEQNIIRGSNRNELMEMIKAEFETSVNKAKFLARQETSLLLSKMRNERYSSSGVKYYRWSTSNDLRVVGKPGGKFPTPSKDHGDHYAMQGKICKMDDATVYADSIEDARAGKWKSKTMIMAGTSHPGEEFNCRCWARPIVG